MFAHVNGGDCANANTLPTKLVFFFSKILTESGGGHNLVAKGQKNLKPPKICELDM